MGLSKKDFEMMERNEEVTGKSAGCPAFLLQGRGGR
jgi:hypothetical protein